MRTVTINSNALGVNACYPLAIVQITEGANKVTFEKIIGFDENQQSFVFENEATSNFYFVKVKNISFANFWIDINVNGLAAGDAGNGYERQVGSFASNTDSIIISLTSSAVGSYGCTQKTSGTIAADGKSINLSSLLVGDEALGFTGTVPTSILNVSKFAMAGGWVLPNPYFFKKKVCSVPLQDVVNCIKDVENIGIGQYVNFIPSVDLLLMPEIAPLHGSIENADFATAIGTFAYKPGKLFTRIQTLPDGRMFDLSSEGTLGQLSPKSQLVFNLPFSKSAYGAIKKLLNTPGVVVFSNGTNERIIIGTLLFPAKIADVQIKQSETESVITITFTNGVKYPMFYTGTL
jgi:hypothetical protein